MGKSNTFREQKTNQQMRRQRSQRKRQRVPRNHNLRTLVPQRTVTQYCVTSSSEVRKVKPNSNVIADKPPETFGGESMRRLRDSDFVVACTDQADYLQLFQRPSSGGEEKL